MSLFGCDHGPLIAQLRSELATADAREVRRVAEMDALRERADDLLSRLLAMKASGFVLPESVTMHDFPVGVRREPISGVMAETGTDAPMTVIPPSEPDELAALIDVQCGRDYRKRAMMLAQLKVDRAGGVDESTIRTSIVNGVQAEGVAQ